MKQIYIILVAVVVMIGCKSEKSGKQDLGSVNTTTAKKEVVSEVNTLPSLTEPIIRNIALNCDYVDYIFYDLPISISQDEKQAIVSNINFISRETVPSIPNKCKPMGRKFFHIDGEIVLEADVYLNREEGCYFYVFYEDGKQAYANKISNDGVNFYFNVFNQAGLK